MKTTTWYAGFLGAALLLLSLWNVLRMARALLGWQTLVEYGAPAVYILASGLVWALAGFGLLTALLSDWRYTRRAGIAFSVLYWVWYWADRLFIQSAPAPNLIFSAIFSSLLLLAILPLWLLPYTETLSTKEIE
ncbi:MAG: hypothetical protein RBS68_13150 [Anaerolineales bacterium]|jgi:hypothetical protein|nr:hypothetical protein [Anaerolineales bacterium]